MCMPPRQTDLQRLNPTRNRPFKELVRELVMVFKIYSYIISIYFAIRLYLGLEGPGPRPLFRSTWHPPSPWLLHTSLLDPHPKRDQHFRWNHFRLVKYYYFFLLWGWTGNPGCRSRPRTKLISQSKYCFWWDRSAARQRARYINNRFD